jgi:Flp pilus assembly protein TadD
MDRQRASVLIIGSLVFLAYSNSLQGEFVYDDVYFIKENPLIRDLTNVPTIFTSSFWESSRFPMKSFYRPLVVLSYALNFSLGGFEPFGYHLTNVLLHVANVLLVFALVHLLCRRTVFSAAVALLFGLHPINTEAVAWISGRTDLLGAFFTLGALALYILAFPPESSERSEARRAQPLLALSLAAFLLGLFSKESAATLLGVLVVYEVAFRLEAPRKAFRLAPYLAVLAVYVGWRLAVLGGLGASPMRVVANPLVEEAALPRLLTGTIVFGKYLWLLLFPLRLSIDYSFNTIPVARTLWAPGVVISGLAGLGLLGLCLFCWRRNILAFFGLGFFLATGSLIFANALFPFGPIVGERFMYLPSVGFVLAGAGLVRWMMDLRPERPGAVAAGVLAAALLAGFFVRTWSRNFDWRDDFSLFRSAADVNPESTLVQTGLAHQYSRKGELVLARSHYGTALEIYPDYFYALNGLGNVALKEKNHQEALEHFSRAANARPSFDMPHVGLGTAYVMLGKLDEAQREYETALRKNPNNSAVYTNLGNLYYFRGDSTEAAAFWLKAVELNPSNAEALSNLGFHYDQLGQKEEARSYFQRFLAVAPDGMKDLKRRVRAELSAE